MNRLLALLVVLCSAGASSAHAEDLTELDTRLDVRHRALSGAARITVENRSGAAVTHAYFWLYPNHFTKRPSALDDVNFYWVFPYRFDPGFMRVSSVKIGGRTVPSRMTRDDLLLEVDLPDPVPPGASVSVEMQYDVAIPERYGGFGCVDGSCLLLGGFYPMLASSDLDAPPAATRFAGRMTILDADHVVVAGRHQLGPIVDLASPAAPILSVVVAPYLHEETRVHEGVAISYLSPDDPPPVDDANKVILAYTLEDRGKRILDAAEHAIDLMAEAGAPMPAATRLTIVTGALRLELARAEPGMVVLSDRLLEIFPVERFRKFHERELVRALYGEYLARAAVPGDPGPEAAAAFLTDLFTVRAWGKEEYAKQILSPVEFIPAVDNIIYAPQIPFAESYFADLADKDSFRDDPRRFMNVRPRGSLIYEKLRDLFDAEQMAAAMKGIFVGKTAREAAEAAAGHDLSAFFAQWSGRYPKVDYALGARRDVLEGEERWRHEVEVEKRTPAGQSGPEEPVTVQIVDSGGKKHDLKWDGGGARGTVALVDSSPDVARVEIDPAGRLYETTVDGSSDDPKFNDRDPHKWKFLYNSFGALFNVSDLSAELLLDFALRQIHDVKNTIRLELFSSAAITVGGSVGYTRNFGPQITPLRLDDHVGTTVSVSRLSPNFGLAPSAGTRASVSLAYSFDDRLFLFQPQRANSFGIGARWSVTRFDDGSFGTLNTFTASANWSKVMTPWDGHTMVFAADAAVVAGDLNAIPLLLAAGGDGGLRGYGPSEIFGRAYLMGHFEWRGTVRHDLDWNFGNWFMLHGIEVAGFVDVGAVSGCSSYSDLFDSQNLFGSVGFGLRFYYDDFGVQPAMMGLDFAIPTVLRQRECLGAANTIDQSGGRPPFMVYLTFLPPF